MVSEDISPARLQTINVDRLLLQIKAIAKPRKKMVGWLDMLRANYNFNLRDRIES